MQNKFGSSRIRTYGAINTPVFKTGTINRSVMLPFGGRGETRTLTTFRSPVSKTGAATITPPAQNGTRTWSRTKKRRLI